VSQQHASQQHVSQEQASQKRMLPRVIGARPSGLLAAVPLIGVYSVNSSVIDISIKVVSGGVGYLLRKLGYEMAPLLLAFIPGDRLESSFRLALTFPTRADNVGRELYDFFRRGIGCGARVRTRAPAADPGARMGVRVSQVSRRTKRSRRR
jgi:hypothetical protein